MALGIIKNELEEKDTTGVAVLYLGCFADPVDCDSGNRLSYLLGSKNIGCYRFEMPGHHTRKQDSEFTLSTYINDISQVVDSIILDGYSNVVIVASSISALAAKSILEKSDSVSAVMYLNPAFDLEFALLNMFSKNHVNDDNLHRVAGKVLSNKMSINTRSLMSEANEIDPLRLSFSDKPQIVLYDPNDLVVSSDDLSKLVYWNNLNNRKFDLGDEKLHHYPQPDKYFKRLIRFLNKLKTS